MTALILDSLTAWSFNSVDGTKHDTARVKWYLMGLFSSNFAVMADKYLMHYMRKVIISFSDSLQVAKPS